MSRRLALLFVVVAGGCQRQHVRIPPDDACNDPSCALACLEGQTQCGSACVNLSSDPAHCGDCATRCPTDYYCVLGVCSFGCDAPLEVCTAASGGAECIDVSGRVDNCGGCGADDPSHVCVATADAGTTAVCNSGECGWECQAGLLDCHDAEPGANGEPTCLSRLADNCHCGNCTTSCRSWSFDTSSLTCASTGPVGEACCGGGCTPLDSDTSCGTSCDDVANCARTGRNCCPKSATTFGCVDESTDLTNCRGCGNNCVGDNPACCTSGCADLAHDLRNCGACGTRCFGFSPACCPLADGSAGVSCIDTQDDPRHCGACGNDCASVVLCAFPESPRCNSGLCGCGVL